MSIDKYYLKGLFEAACKQFDRDTKDKYPGKPIVYIGGCPDHFIDRVYERIVPRNPELAEQVTVASVKSIEKLYPSFFELTKSARFGIIYHSLNIRYNMVLHRRQGIVKSIEITPVTVY